MSLTIPKSPSVKSIRILIVEDEGIIAEDMQDCLENIGYSVVGIVDTGEKAIQAVAATHPDLLLMDIRLKGTMDGIQAAQKIWDIFKVPVIYTTGHSDPSTLERAKVTAPFGYLLKPFEERELHVTIETALRRYHLEKQLKEREEWLNTIFRSIGDGVIVVDYTGRINFLNPRAEALTGWKYTEAVDKSLIEIFKIIHESTRQPAENPVTELFQCGINLYLATNKILISQTGIEIPIDISAAPLKDIHGKNIGGVLVFRDITERRQAEERNRALERAKQLEVQMIELQRLNQLKDEFLSTVSHEMRTPISNIKMAVQMLEIALDKQGILLSIQTPASSQAARYLQILHEECEQELNLINDLLDLQRLNAKVYPLSPREIQLQELIPDIANVFGATLQSNKQHLQIHIPPELPSLFSDSRTLTRIVRELLNNACKYTPPGESIAICAYTNPTNENSTPKNGIQLCITNRGVEIPPHELPHVFDKFYRIPSIDRWRHGGTGLGLALVKQLVDYLGGSIRVESASGKVCFTMELPLNFHDSHEFRNNDEP